MIIVFLILNLSQYCDSEYLSEYDYLRYHWPIQDGSMDEAHGSKAHMFGGVNAEFTMDRFNEKNSAIRLTNGYYQLPSGVYVDSAFTMMAWVKPLQENQRFARIFNFDVDDHTQNILFSFSNENKLRPVLEYTYTCFRCPMIKKIKLVFNESLVLNKWQHVAVTASPKVLVAFLNGKRLNRITNSDCQVPPHLIRSLNYIGKSDEDANSNAYADFDDLRIYDKAISMEHIKKACNTDNQKRMNIPDMRTTKTTTILTKTRLRNTFFYESTTRLTTKEASIEVAYEAQNILNIVQSNVVTNECSLAIPTVEFKLLFILSFTAMTHIIHISR